MHRLAGQVQKSGQEHLLQLGLRLLSRLVEELWKSLDNFDLRESQWLTAMGIR
jgi:hypothetical protein